ncbi:MAG: hypothetical protein LBF95_09010 [Treponema sp.]|jgi:hypothetical protein|nr:hypothetical protein [Treponema sp.]
MKKYSVFVAGILSVTLVFVLILAGCNPDSDPGNPFEGTWKGEVDGESVTLTITDSGTWTVEGLYKGTYTRDGDSAVFTPTHYLDENEWKAIPEGEAGPVNTTVSGNTLKFPMGESGTEMTFTK